ncbi:MAG: FKBP-type peptidyl-prolyl cis-trans isomerase [Chloroflexota bacterium]
MMNAERGDKVTIAYELLTEEGVFDSSERSGPRTVTIGKGETLEVFESALIGMATGERKTVHVPAEKGYGLRDESRVFVFHRSRAPQGFDPPVGQRVEMFRADGERVEVTVLGKSDDSFTMDANHPLAGKDLDFHLTVLEIVKSDSQ